MFRRMRRDDINELLKLVLLTSRLQKRAMAKKLIVGFIDFFYPPFRKLMPLQTFRYAACGGANTLLDIFIYFISYNFILHKQVLDLGFFAIKPHIAAFLISFSVSFPTGFLLSRNIVFTESTLHGRVQLSICSELRSKCVQQIPH